MTHSPREPRAYVDELEYTRSGLETREPIPLRTGRYNRIVLTRAARARAACATFGAFAPRSSFPTPGILISLLALSFADFFADIGLPTSRPIFQVFGHAMADDDEPGNKALADRRAQLFVAMLTSDVDTVQGIADTEGWGLREQQVMLRVLRCDPGAIDGEPGKVTSTAVGLFQAEYAGGVFHRHRDDGPRNPQLPVNGKLDGATAKALVEGFVVACSPQLEPDRLHPTHPFAGCSEYNTLAKEPSHLDRRLAIVAHDELPVHHENQPCKQGDHLACPVDELDAVSRCSWYRTHVVDPDPAAVIHRHFDLRWLVLPNGKLLLSALTTVPDEGEVTFQVFRTTPIASVDDLQDAALEEPLCEPKVGLIRGGVAQLVWEPPAGFSVFDVDAWLVPMVVTRPSDAWHAKQLARVPVFRVAGGGVTAISPPPGDDASRIASELTSRLNDAPLEDVLVMDAFGTLARHRLENGRANPKRHSLAPDERRVLAVRYASGYLPPDDRLHGGEIIREDE